MKTMGNNEKRQVLNVLFRVILWISAAPALAGCGGGSGSSAPPPPQSARLTYPSSSLTFVAGTAITPVAPSASQGLSTY
jgi:hypothetical protein